MTTPTSTGRDWTTMRAQDFDTAAPLTIVDSPTAPLASTGDDLLALLGVPVAAPKPTRTTPATTAPTGVQSSLF